MKAIRFSVFAQLTMLAFSVFLSAQQPAPSVTTVSAVVPRMVNFSGTAVNATGKPLSGAAGITFSIYKDQAGGAPLWMETQSVQADGRGNYSIQLGATKADGLPMELFASGEARWLGARVNGGEEQPRVMLLSVPYALKAGDAATIGGLPPSAFLLAGSQKSSASETSVDAESSDPGLGAPPPASTVTTSGGTVNALPLWTTATNVQSSAITQTGSGATAKIGIGTTVPAAALDVKGSEYVRGALTLPATGNATATVGKNSQPQDLIASSFSSASSTPLNQKFQWQAEPAANDTANPSGTLNLLFGLGATTPAETGLKLSNKGIFTFATGQTFPSTVKSVGISAPASDFVVSGSPVMGTGTIALTWTVAPTSLNTPSAIVKRDASGNISTSQISATSNVKGIAAITAGSTIAGGTGISGSSIGGFGVTGYSGDAVGVFGSGGTYGVSAYSGSGTAVYANSGFIGLQASGGGTGVVGEGRSSEGVGVYGTGITGVQGIADTTGVYGSAVTYGVYGDGQYGVFGNSGTWGVWGESTGADGVHGVSHTSGGSGVGAINDSGGDGIYAAVTAGGFAGFFYGDVDVDGNLTKAAGSFKIDHPLDPANKYLYHSFVESPDMMNIYNGNVTLDGNGEAFVSLPEWFQTLNRDFRYQLTCLDGFAPIYVAQRVQSNHFKIAGGKPGMEVSWQVTGVRQDAWANAHRIPVEQLKPEKERGSYLHPELFGAAPEKSIAWARHPETMKRAKEHQPLPAVPRLPSPPAKH